jgi:hypothetical protein
MMSQSLTQCDFDSCTYCDLAWIVKDHMRLLMKLFRNDLSEYSMQMVDTKCLNTAVIIMFMLLGSPALQHTRYCDVENVRSRAKSNIDYDSAAIAKDLRQSLLRKNQNNASSKRELYYIMMTNYTVREHFFTGHVFVIERIPQVRELSNAVNAAPARYMLYQSYLDEFNLQEFFEMNANTFEIPYHRLSYWMDELVKFYENDLWDEDTMEFWKSFTGVEDVRSLKGSEKKGFSHLCFQRVPVTNCTRVLKQHLQKVIQDKELMDELEEPELNSLDQLLSKLQTSNTARRNGP